jgi:hypothetical protein
VANTTAVTTAIDNAATYGTDVFLTFHQIVLDSTPDGSMSTIKCRVADVQTIAAAIKAQIDVGKLEAVTFAKLALNVASVPSYWGQLG